MVVAVGIVGRVVRKRHFDFHIRLYKSWESPARAKVEVATPRELAQILHCFDQGDQHLYMYLTTPLDQCWPMLDQIGVMVNRHNWKDW